MNRQMILPLLPLLAVMGVAPLGSQPSAFQSPTWRRFRDLNANLAKLNVAVKLDRDVYFPGEDAHITITVANPTPQILEVPKPFDPETGALQIKAPGVGPLKGEWVDGGLLVRGHAPVTATAEPIIPQTVWLSPTQPLETAFWLSESGCNHHVVAFVGPCTLEEKEGQYRLSYGYSANAFATFNVVWPQFEQWAEAVLAKPYQYEEVLPNKVKTGKIRIIQRKVRAMVLAYEGSHFLAVSNQAVTTGPQVWRDPSGKLSAGMNRQFGIYRRVATSAVPITSLQVSADSAENITISYTDQNGQRFTLKLDANHKLISP